MMVAPNISSAKRLEKGTECLPSAELDNAARAMFIELIPTRIVDIENLMRISKSQHCVEALEKVGQIAHRLAGTAITIGMHEIDRLSRMTERGILDFLQSSIPTTNLPIEIEQTIELLLDELEEMYFS